MKEKQPENARTPRSSTSSEESLHSSAEYTPMSEPQLTKESSYDLARYEKGVKFNAKSIHKVMRVPAEGKEPEKSIYELTEQFYTTESRWNRDMSPGVMERNARTLAEEVKRVAELAATRLGSSRSIALEASAYAK
jgi:hypothetical protein